MRISTFGLFVLLMTLVGCRHTLPGTHVEVIDKGGEKVYHTGAASMGQNKMLACGGAHKRCVAAIALRFAQDNDDLADDIAEAVGVSDGEVFLQKFAKNDARTLGAHDEEFDPIEHVCMVTVTWKAPIFVKEAIMKFAEKMKEAELGGGDASAAPAPATTTAAPSTVSPAPATAAPAPAPVVDPCADERASLKKARKVSGKAQDDFDECMRRTKNDETICHRYKLYLDEAKGKEGSRDKRLADCLATGG